MTFFTKVVIVIFFLTSGFQKSHNKKGLRENMFHDDYWLEEGIDEIELEVLNDNSLDHDETRMGKKKEVKNMPLDNDFRIEDLALNADYESGLKNSSDPDIGYHGKYIDVVSGFARTGEFSVRHELNSNDPIVAGSKRCESDSMAKMSVRIKVGQEQFYGFSFYLPYEWDMDPEEKIDDILIQWKAFSTGPNMFLTQKRDALNLRMNSNPHENYTSGTMDDDTIRSQFTIVKPILTGVWHDIVVRVIWDYKPEGVGKLELYYKTSDDSEYDLIVDEDGPNCYNREGYLKWGIYKPYWRDHPDGLPFNKRILYHDNIRIGTSFDKVDPSQN